MNEKQVDRKRLLLSLIFPLVLVAVIWLIKITEVVTGKSLSGLGLTPLRSEGLVGIIMAPLLHGDWKHLFNNTFPLFFLLWTIFYFYHEIAWRVFVLVYFLSQFWLWFFARESTHIGASGLIYGFGAFLFVSGLIRRNKNLLAISLIVTFLYGSMVWGIFPIRERMSWEGHLMGMLAGIILAFFYKKHGPPLPNTRYYDEFEEGDEDEEDDENAYWKVGGDDPEV